MLRMLSQALLLPGAKVFVLSPSNIWRHCTVNRGARTRRPVARPAPYPQRSPRATAKNTLW